VNHILQPIFCTKQILRWFVAIIVLFSFVPELCDLQGYSLSTARLTDQFCLDEEEPQNIHSLEDCSWQTMHSIFAVNLQMHENKWTTILKKHQGQLASSLWRVSSGKIPNLKSQPPFAILA
jgi:hypothetical protein